MIRFNLKFGTGKTVTTAAIILFVFLIAPLSIYSQTNGEDESGKTEKIEEFEEKNLNIIPGPVILLDDHMIDNIIVVDKKEQKLMLYKNDGSLHRIKTFICTTGANQGIKTFYGDLKTPEGVYFFNKIREANDLRELYGSYVAKQYGIRAFDITFPNPVDRYAGRRGSGIWLHGTDQPDRIGVPYDTRGCVVLTNDNIELLTNYIELNKTPVIILDRIDYVTNFEIISKRQLIQNFLISWERSWETVDLETYGNCYAENFRNKGMDLTGWLNYKDNALRKYEWIDVNISNTSILRGKEYYYIQFVQEFSTDIFKDKGIKKLYLLENSEGLQIIREEWIEINE